jgi:hypothetical protein
MIHSFFIFIFVNHCTPPHRRHPAAAPPCRRRLVALATTNGIADLPSWAVA